MSLREQDRNDPLAEIARMIGRLPYGEPVILDDGPDDEVVVPPEFQWEDVIEWIEGMNTKDGLRSFGKYIPCVDDALYPRLWLCKPESPEAIRMRWSLERIA